MPDEVVTHQWQCHNPICIRVYWISYINICPTCEFSGEPVKQHWPIDLDFFEGDE